MQKSRSELKDLAYAFLAAGSQSDLSRLMAFFAEDAILEASNGNTYTGIEAIAECFRPFAAGEFGIVRYEADDFFCEVESQKVLINPLPVIALQNSAFCSTSVWNLFWS